jgi:2-amino-4-hydroxy-6-hydroxymethyldihydropteridine diphosphokinase
MNDLYLMLGSNLGDRMLNIRNATEQIINEIGPWSKASSFYETEPWGNIKQGMFLNRILKFKCLEKPDILLEKLLSIEIRLGRQRDGEAYSARTIDIDILLYGDIILSGNHLIIPHPRLHLRNFVLIPLFEIAPDLVHPVLNMSVRELLSLSPDNLDVNILNSIVNLS